MDDWWDEVFACRFVSGNLPRPGTALLGARLRIQIEVAPGEWEDYEQDRHGR